MSKMSDIHLDLTEQANELGFESIGEAEQAGYGVDWKNIKLIKVEDETPAWCKRYERYDEEQEKAHEAWLKERTGVLADLRYMLNEEIPFGDQDKIDALSRVIDFIERGEV